MKTNKRIQLLSIILGVLALVAIIYSTTNRNQPEETTANHLEGFEIEENPAMENPEARWEYERQMLVDPATGEIPANIRRKEIEFGQKIDAALAQIRSAAPGNFSDQFSSESSENNSFVNWGPHNLGGRVRGLALDVDDENIIIAGGVTGGVWRSTDAGQSWVKTTSPNDFPSVSTIIQDQRPGHTSDWYFAGGEFVGNSAAMAGAFYYGDGIYRSTDGGQSWNQIAATTVGNNVQLGPYSVIGELAIDNSNLAETEIYVAGVSQIIRTTTADFSNASTVLGVGNGGANQSDVVVTSAGRVFASIGNSNSNGANPTEGVFTSADGISWTDITPPGLPSTYVRIELALDPSNENILYAVGGQAVGGNLIDFLMRYNLQTDTWEDLSANMDSSSDVGEGHNQQGGYNLYVSVHPESSNTVFVGGTNLLRSTDGFGSSGGRSQVGGYQPDNNPASFGLYTGHHPDQHNAVYLPSDGDIMITATDGGLFRTENNRANISGPNPVTWSSLNNGFVTAQFYAMDYLRDARGDRRIPGGMQDNGSWINYTGNPTGDWTDELGGDGSYSAITYNSLYLSAQEGQVRRFVFNNGTQEFDQVANIQPSTDDAEFIFINPFIVNPVNQDQLFIGTVGQVYYTDDVRQNPGIGQWQTLTATGLSGERVSVLAASIQPAHVLYFGTRNGNVYRVDDLRNITTGTEITGDNMPNDATVSGIAVDPQDADRVFVSYSNYGVSSIWMTEDGGTSWTAIGGNLEENPDGTGNGPSIRWMEVLPDGNGGRLVFAGTSIGLYMTNNPDGDNTVWEAQSPDAIGRNLVNMIKVRPNEGQVVVATHGNGVYIGEYEVANTPTINYSVLTPDEEIILRGPTSSVSGEGFTYQWVRNNEDIDGATASTLTITDGGTYKLRLTDEKDESVTESNELIFFLDGVAPSITSVLRLDPVAEEVEASEVTFQVTFDEEVQNVNIADFEATGDVTGTIFSVTPIQNNQVFDVVVNNLGGQGTLGLGVISGTDITDPAGNAFSGTVNTAETYTIIDQTAPTAAITRLTPTTEVTNQVRLNFAVTFSEAVTNVDAADFGLSASSVASAIVESVSQGSSAAVYSVIISGITEDGLVDLDFAAANDIEDLAGNAFSGTVTTDETYTVEDNVVTSINDPSFGVPQVTVKQNPAEGLFTITLSDAYLNGFELKVIDGNGSEVFATQKERYASQSELTVDITSLPDGLYILNVANEQRKDVVKLLKQSN